MTDPYIGQDILDQAAEALRQNVPLTTLASRLRCSSEHLARLLNLPSKPAQQQSDELDLWAADKMQEVL
jgi:hypothetical protein